MHISIAKFEEYIWIAFTKPFAYTFPTYSTERFRYGYHVHVLAQSFFFNILVPIVRMIFVSYENITVRLH